MPEGMKMVTGRLPDEGPVRIGPVTLPPGMLVTGWHGGDHHVAWATVDPVPGSGQVWAALAELHPQTGLVPIQLDGLSGDTRRPWDNGEFVLPENPRDADSVDVGAFLKSGWRCWVPPPDEDDPEWIEALRPFTREWPGLAPPGRTPLTPAERRHALDVVLPRIRVAHRATAEARIGLVAADRPADVPAVIGWEPLYPRGESLLPLTAVLRSWEDRFGARVIDVGFADLRLLVERPPRTLEAAQRLAAEQVVLADDCIDGARDIPNTAARLQDGSVWTFWWD